jgi:hypothetical protein
MASTSESQALDPAISIDDLVGLFSNMSSEKDQILTS